jgi:hypothetical protein
MSMANCGTLEDFSSFSHVFDRSFPASAGQSHLHWVPAKEFRAFPSHRTANFRPSKWSFFPGDPRRLQSTPYNTFSEPIGIFAGYFPQEQQPDYKDYLCSGVISSQINSTILCFKRPSFLRLTGRATSSTLK